MASDGEAQRGKDLVLPLDCTLEECCRGAIRKVKVNCEALARSGNTVAEEIFEVRIEKGVPDGHWVVLPGKAKCGDGEPGDVVFVLHQRRHPHFRRQGLDLHTERTITLLEALTGYSLVIDHPDGRRLLVKSRPGEIVRPRNLLPDAEADWERFDGTDAFAGQDAGSMRTGDLEACKELCRQRGFGGFTFWEDTAYFRAHSRDELLAARQRVRDSTLYVCPDPEKSASVRMQRAVRGAGMPAHGNPEVRGNLFILLRVAFPDVVDDAAAELLRLALPVPAGRDATRALDVSMDDAIPLADIDPVESARQHRIAAPPAGASATQHSPEDEAPPPGHPGPPPCRQM